MAQITIVKGAEFKIVVKEKITKDDLFIEQYKQAARMLDEITGASKKALKEGNNGKSPWSWKSQDFENNIIVFCGERGEGKSSAMMTFVNAVHKDRKNEIFENCRHIKEAYFAEPLLIDPSLFDDVHNVLDIVLAKIFKNFYACYNEDNQCVDERTREKLLDRFQKVYRYVSLINNQKQMLDDEFDYEGNISKLTKLGESTNLKEELAKLIEDYLRFLQKDGENQQLVIAIDDLDLCSANAFKMTEQIRKYLIIPHVCIVMSVRVEQLELCIREKNLKDFQEIYKNKDEKVYGQLNREVQMMAERYVSKLIPGQRRIYIPKVQRFEDVRIIYKEADSDHVILDSWKLDASDGQKGFTPVMLDLICRKTGMQFLPEADGSSYLLPDNLRDMISWILMIAEMEEPQELKAADGEGTAKDELTEEEDAAARTEAAEKRDRVYSENIARFEKYFEREWAGDNLNLYDGLTMQDLGSMDTFHLHVTVQRILEEAYRETDPEYSSQPEDYIAERADSFFLVMKWFELFRKNVTDKRKEAYAYRLRTLYTIKINRFLRNRQYAELSEFFNGYIWGPAFNGTFPSSSKSDRSRFEINPVLFGKWIKKKIDGIDTQSFSDDKKIHYVSHIPKGEERNDVIIVWIVIGILSNVCELNKKFPVYSYEGKIIADNSAVCSRVQVSLENYIISLCNLDMLYEKINIQKIGVGKEEFEKIIDDLKEKNKDSIQYARSIAANMDLLLGLKDYCIKNRDYKESTSDETDRSKMLAQKFFVNIEKYMDRYGVKADADKLRWFILDEKHKEYKIDIALLYAELFDMRLEKWNEKETAEGLVAEFREKITELPAYWSHDENRASQSLRNRTVEHVKNNLDILASGIQRYLGENRKQPDTLDVERLCALYSSVVVMYLEDKDTKITDKMYEEYKQLVKIQNEMRSEAE